MRMINKNNIIIMHTQLKYKAVMVTDRERKLIRTENICKLYNDGRTAINYRNVEEGQSILAAEVGEAMHQMKHPRTRQC